LQCKCKCENEHAQLQRAYEHRHFKIISENPCINNEVKKYKNFRKYVSSAGNNEVGILFIGKKANKKIKS
jgi:hypothetical protein